MSRSAIAGLISRLQDPECLSWRVAWWYLPYGAIGPIVVDRARLGTSWGQTLTLIVVGQVTIFVGIAVARIALRIRSPLPVVAVIALALLTAVLRGYVLAVTAVKIDATTSLELAYRVFSGVGTHATMLLVIGVVVAGAAQKRRVMTELTVQYSTLKDIDEHLVSELATIDASLLRRVREIVEPRLITLDATIAGSQSHSDRVLAAKDIQNFLENDLQPLSRQLVEVTSEVTPVPKSETSPAPMKSHWPRAIRLQAAFSPGIATFLYIVSAWSTALRDLQFLQSLVFLSLIAALTWVLWTLCKRVSGEIFIPPVLAIVIAAVCGGVISFVSIAAISALPIHAPKFLLLAGTLVAAVIGALLALRVPISDAQADTEARLRAANLALADSIGLLRQQEWFRRMRLSYLLHGHLQGSLNAALIRLGSSVSPHIDVVTEARNDLKRAFRDLENAGATFLPTLEYVLTDLSSMWARSCDIQWRISETAQAALAQSPVLNACAGELVREGIHNAVVHGKATSISVTAACTDRHLVLVVRDNGVSEPELHGDGLGTRMLNDVSLSWNRTNTSKGTVLRCVLARSALQEHAFALH